MTIDAAKEAREILAKTIQESVEQFELATGMYVDAIEISKIAFITNCKHPSATTTIRVKVSI